MKLSTRVFNFSAVVIACACVREGLAAQNLERQHASQGQQAQSPGYPPPVVTPEEFDGWMKHLSNWGRWGKEDQLGAFNLITRAKRKQALALATEGISVSLARQPLTEKAVDADSPFERQIFLGGLGLSFATERISMSYHGRAHSHIDALCHVSYKGQIYNGFSFKGEVTNEGCAKNGIQNLRNGILTRGILIDIPRLKGVPYLEPQTSVYPKDIEEWEKKTGVKVGAGDAIFLRTGRWARRAKFGPFIDFAGYHALVGPWLKIRDVAIVAGDAIQDVGSLPGIGAPIHTFAIAGLGIYIIDNLDLEAIAETAAKLHRWEFLFTAAPIPANGGTGSPLNPIATF